MRITIGGSAAAEVPVDAAGDMVGRSAADGRFALEVPGQVDDRIRAETGESDGELRFDFGE